LERQAQFLENINQNPLNHYSLVLEKRGKIRIIVAERGIMVAKPHEKTEIIAISRWI
jgi:hypothetical protein